MEIKVYRAQIKFIEQTVKSFTDDELIRILSDVQLWRNSTDSIDNRIYTLHISDQDGPVYTSIV